MRRRFLVSPPAGYDTHHLLNPWMRWDEQVDTGLAARQWHGLLDALVDAGAEVEVMEPAGRSGALTFTRDAAVVSDDGKAVVLPNHGLRGDLEPRHVSRWLRRNGYVVARPPRGLRIDGGNVVAVPEGWLVGIPPGAGTAAPRWLARRLRSERVTAVPLRSARFGHLDTALADLGGRGWLLYPGAFADGGTAAPEWTSVWARRPVIRVTEQEAAHLACNVVVVDDVVIGGGLSPRLCAEIETLGLHPVPLALDEFQKAGGGAHCLTLDLDRPRHGRCNDDQTHHAIDRGTVGGRPRVRTAFPRRPAADAAPVPADTG